ncbi:hypothetical protein BSS2_II0642 [Brucella suis bv. 1 str. S2]|uniref:Uncharacterized protein n=4 Tax=Brucella TaxID=234 RepID=Q2YKT3_BRUA2|nr:hypothetical protein BRA0674 [Brucella suis 1330]AAX75971.1 hypothetical protein BruAb2_0554 [Brucella abortus bv. 1 str. 9-941]ACU49792.1 hypothetical protein BMI_II670 [Brucella microti CCM 4915]AEK56154.1 hypothetical protein BPI_II730 [Brucella pinnipedialis B2/94]AEU07807.1 hypothetical protein BSVBI22_B0666 [Brucella suis VBI22]AHN48404.1 hypothetical protein BSS2_II0642 [Brucella suis bv. 1 str. S2]CAJ12731.1 conserved hypothetical protein [Brucella abortus 2308]CDL78210.1 unnamed 
MLERCHLQYFRQATEDSIALILMRRSPKPMQEHTKN